MRERDIISSILNHFNESYAKDIDWSHPDKFDPEADGMESWVEIQVRNIRNFRRRHGKPRHGTLSVFIDCSSRDQNKILEHMERAGDVAELFAGLEIPIMNYKVNPAVRVGVLSFSEPQIEETTPKRAHWKTARVQIDGVYTQTNI